MGKRKFATIVAAAIGVVVATLAVTLPARASVGAYVQIVNSISTKCAEASPMWNVALLQMPCHNGDLALWFPSPAGNGYVQYVNKATGLCMAGLALDEFVLQRPCDATKHGQWWYWQGADDAGHLVLTSGLGNLCLALDGVYSGRDRWPIVLHSCATTSGQFWHAG